MGINIKAYINEILYSFILCATYPFGIINNEKTLNFNENHLSNHHKQLNPVILIHGYLHNPSAFILLEKRLNKSNWQDVYLFSLKFSMNGIGIEDYSKKLMCKVDEVLEKTGAKKVDLIGHSLGGLVARYFIQNLNGSKKVKHCITMGCPHEGTQLANLALGKCAEQMKPNSRFLKKLNNNLESLKKIMFTSLWSPTDILVLPTINGILKGFRNLRINSVGHLGFLYSERAFHIIKKLLSEDCR